MLLRTASHNSLLTSCAWLLLSASVYCLVNSHHFVFTTACDKLNPDKLEHNSCEKVELFPPRKFPSRLCSTLQALLDGWGTGCAQYRRAACHISMSLDNA